MVRHIPVAPVPARRALLAVAASVPLGILGQFLLAGLALFHGPPGWGAHAVLGFGLIFPIGGVLAASFASNGARPARRWAGATAALYVVQVALIVAGQATGSGILRPARRLARDGRGIAAFPEP